MPILNRNYNVDDTVDYKDNNGTVQVGVVRNKWPVEGRVELLSSFGEPHVVWEDQITYVYPKMVELVDFKPRMVRAYSGGV